MIFTICAIAKNAHTRKKLGLNKDHICTFCEFNSSVNRNMVSASIKIFEKKCAYGN